MKTLKYINILIIITLTLFSCKEEIEFNGEYTEPMVVLNSFICPDSVVSAHLSLSQFFLSDEQSFQVIPDGDIYLHVNGVQKEKLYYTERGMYYGNYRPVAGDTITMTLSASGHDNIHSSTVIPHKADVVSVDSVSTGNTYYDIYTDNNEIAGTSETANYTFSIKIKDNPDEENYYRILLKMKSLTGSETYINDISFTMEGYYEQNSNVFNLMDNSEYWSDNHILSDELINGKEFTLKIKQDIFRLHIRPGYEDYFPGYTFESRELQFYVQAISRDLYLYLKTINASNEIGDGMFSEPVIIHNNIHNAVGILAGYSSSIHTIKID